MTRFIGEDEMTYLVLLAVPQLIIGVVQPASQLTHLLNADLGNVRQS